MPRGRRSRNAVGINLVSAPIPVSVLTQNVVHTFSGAGVKSFAPENHTQDVAVRPSSLSLQLVSSEPCVFEIEARTGPVMTELVAVLRTRPILVGTTPQTVKLRVPRNIDPSRFADWTIRSSGHGVAVGTVTFSYRDGLSGKDGDSGFTML